MEKLPTAEEDDKMWEQAASLDRVDLLRGQRLVPNREHLALVHNQSADHGQRGEDAPSDEHQVQAQCCRKEGPGHKLVPKHSSVAADLCRSDLGSGCSLLTPTNEEVPGK